MALNIFTEDFYAEKLDGWESDLGWVGNLIGDHFMMNGGDGRGLTPIAVRDNHVILNAYTESHAYALPEGVTLPDMAKDTDSEQYRALQGGVLDGLDCVNCGGGLVNERDEEFEGDCDHCGW